MASLGEDLCSLTFTLFTEDEIRKMSVVEVITPNSFDAIDHPINGGLYDLRMGPSGMSSEICLTCKHTARKCPGHFGHIELPIPVVNPLFQKDIFYILKNICPSCKILTVPVRYKCLILYQIKLINAGYLTEAQELNSIICGSEEIQMDEAADIEMKNKILAFIKEKELCLDREVQPTKTTESLRREFLDNFHKHTLNIKSCLRCKKKVMGIVYYQGQLVVPEGRLEMIVQPNDTEVMKSNENGPRKKSGQVVILPGKSKQMLRDVWEVEQELIETLLPVLKHRGPDVTCGTDMLYMNVILVTPPKTRPSMKLRSAIAEHQQSRLYKEIIQNCILLRNVIKASKEENWEGIPDETKAYIEGIKGENMLQKTQTIWQNLQTSVDSLMNSDGRGQGGLLGLKQLLEKKEGALRKYMMGKRVNFAARSVITPDPNLLIEEIGIPEHFAKRLTYPVKANFFNVHELRKMIQNGPDVYPGATMVEMENGSMTRLFPGDANKTKRIGVGKLLLKSIESGGGRTVHRHLLNGDILLLNRQPTLHRPSIMAHKARILKGEKTLRMHYSNCKSYNADFDGDEMNAHLPQNEMARGEAYSIVSVRQNYLVPKDGTPLGGLIQDHVISGVRLTMRGRFFNRQDYYQLVFQGLSHCRGEIKLLPPTILKPKMLWSGKQIISTILMNVIPKNKSLISLQSRAKISSRSWQVHPPRPWKCGKKFESDDEMCESVVIIRNGQLLCGVLDKQHYGATPYGLTHCLYELYGGACSSKFLDSVGKLFTSYLQMNGFTLGIKDILIKESQDEERDKIIQNARKIGDVAAMRALDLKEIPPDLEERLEKAYYNDRTKFKARLDLEYKKLLDSFTNDINRTCLPRGLLTKFPRNNLQLMVTSGAKGSAVNTMQISCLLGQIELEGKRPPLMISGKSLPCYKPFETCPSAGGYIDSRFMTGITPQEFFFHCMAGREGLIDTAVKTSRSGYLQRCLIKHLEGVTVAYDGTVRDHDGSIIQFAYGEDGLEVQKSKFFKQSQMDFLYRNKNSIVDEAVLQTLKDSTDLKKIEKHRKRIKEWDNEWKDEKWRKSCYNGFSLFSIHTRDDIQEKYWRKFSKSTGRCKASQKMVKKWNELDEKSKEAYKSMRPDPLMSKFNRNRDFGVITEKLEDLIDGYLSEKSTLHSKAETIRNVINIKYMSSLCQPGESVGLLAAQSIGEPSTQMTLNTFHFAGRGEMNVTLGIPRLREILMTATKEIKTPYMEIPLKKTSIEKMESRGTKLKKKFQMVRLADVLQTIEVGEKLITDPTMALAYTMKFTFLPFKSYRKVFNTSPSEILKYVEKDFLIRLCKYIRTLGRKYGDLIHESKEEKKLTKANDENEEEEVDHKSVDLNVRERSGSTSSSEEEMDDDDATAARLRERRDEEHEYEAGDDSDAGSKDDEEGEEEGEGEEMQDEQPEEGTEEMTMDELMRVADREHFVLRTFPMVTQYKYDVKNEEWCEMVISIPASLSHIDFSSILKEIAEQSVIYQVTNVKRAILYKNAAGNLSIKTEGINFIELYQYHKLLDLNKIYSNDIHEMARVYGIEAAARVIVNELKEVFGVYGITVDPRHLLLIADFMTHQGVFSPFNRTGMVNNSSPLQQMSFESTIGFLKEAITGNKTDKLTSPSASIMVGRYCASGTGTFDLINESIYATHRKHQPKDYSIFNGSNFE